MQLQCIQSLLMLLSFKDWLKIFVFIQTECVRVSFFTGSRRTRVCPQRLAHLSRVAKEASRRYHTPPVEAALDPQ